MNFYTEPKGSGGEHRYHIRPTSKWQAQQQ